VPFYGTSLQQSGSSSLAIRLWVVGGAVGKEKTLPLPVAESSPLSLPLAYLQIIIKSRHI